MKHDNKRVREQIEKSAITLDDIEDWLKELVEDEKSDEEWMDVIEQNKFVKVSTALALLDLQDKELREKLAHYKKDYGSTDFYKHLTGYREIKEILGHE